ncbi:CHAT domain-containing protein [Micromonospora sp. NBC_01739]|uniref:CHAT domain-containing protein n=1 Tax=Micromonospora sp. NBC_01739 TaxID=2975985 RepID=UPI002E114429|nr:CHAT domain-containing protein [Micromonospora sp. NBC_01739]
MNGYEETEEVPLDDWIAHLRVLAAAPPPGEDPAELAGLLGQAYGERYARDQDEDSLRAAIVEFDRALTRAPDHEQAPLWHWAKGMSHLERTWLDDDRTDHEGAVRHLIEAYRGWPPDDTEREDVAESLLESIWNRYLWRYAQSETPQATIEYGVEAMQDLEVVLSAPSGEESTAYARMLLGVVLLNRYDHAGQEVPDLDQGTALLAESLARLSPDTTPHYFLACTELVAAYLEAAGLREDRMSLESAIQFVDRAVAACPPGQAMRLHLRRHQAEAYAARWRLDPDPANLTRAIDCWRAVCADDDDPACGVALAELLHALGDLDSLTEAVTLLERALPSAPRPMWVWRQLGETYLARWETAEVPGSLETADRCLDRALTEGGTPDQLLSVHATRVVVAKALLEHESARDPDRAPPSLHRVREILDEGGHALDDATESSTRDRALLATVLLSTELGHAVEALVEIDSPRLHHLLAVGRMVGDDPPAGMTVMLDLSEAMLEQFDQVTVGRGAAGDSLRTFLRAAADETVTKADAKLFRAMLPHLLHTRAARYRDDRSHRAARVIAADLARGESPTAVVVETQVVSAVMAALGSGRMGDVEGMRTATRRAVALRRRLGPSRLNAALLDPMVHLVEDLVANLDGREIRPQPPVPLPPGPLTYVTSLSVLAGAVQVMAAIRRLDLTLLRQWADHLTDLAGRFEQRHVMRVASLATAAKAQLPLARLGQRQAAVSAVALLEQATAETATDLAIRVELVHDLAYALRLAGDPDRARTRRLGLDGLHGRARRVLLQAGTDHAMATARQAAGTATTVVRWCLQDQADDDLVAALDAGRGLVLHAATASRNIADLLEEAGQAELAREWRQTGGLGRDQLTGDALGAVFAGEEVPDDLRVRVLHALDLTTHGPLAQVRPDEISSALTESGADALVYLVPAAHPVPGLAVVVPRVGQVEILELRDLAADDNAPVRRLLRAAFGTDLTDSGSRAPRDAGPAGGSRDAGPIGGHRAPSVGTAIDDLCRWAWRAAMSHLVEYLRPPGSASPARVVLVPMGVLGLVPWHAAYRETASGRRYAVHDLIVSYSPSARLLCSAAARPVQPVRSALVVGDPLGDLPFAGIEAQAIHGRFHPEGRYLGGPTDDPEHLARPQAVLEWVRTVGAGSSLLHLACHGRVDPARPADSHLVLAGGLLPARELLEVSRVAALDLGQVFLAACTTNLAGGLPDEAFSLSTAFLAAGAQTVFGSLWSVPDVGTSLLMYQVHHFLHQQGCAPAEALHRAQLWMLDPHRAPPEGMPPELAVHCSRVDNAAPLAWAAFTHLGR